MKWLKKLLAKFKSEKDNSLYHQIGGAAVVTAISNSFYDVMENDKYAKSLLEMHPKPLNRIRQLFDDYIAMWLGGPDNYTPTRGHPRLRARHLPYPISGQLKNEWMYCMRIAIRQHVKDKKLADAILLALDELAQHMINTD